MLRRLRSGNALPNPVTVPSAVTLFEPLTPVSSVTAPLAFVAAVSIVGVSLVPVMVTVTSWVTVAPLLSFTVIV